MDPQLPELNLPPKLDIPSKRDMNREELAKAEATIAKGKQTFMDVGLALMDIRERRGYRFTHPTFEDYCQAKWGWTASRSRQLIGAVETVRELESVTGVTLSTEAQAREVKKIGTDTVAGELKEALKTSDDPVKAVNKVIKSHAAPAPKSESKPDPEPHRVPLGDAAPDAGVSDDEAFERARDEEQRRAAAAKRTEYSRSCPVCDATLWANVPIPRFTRVKAKEKR